MWGIVTDTPLGDRRVSAIYVACYTVYLIIAVIGAGEEAESSVSRLRAEYGRRFGKMIIDGLCFVNFAEEDVLRDRSVMNHFDIIMFGSLSVATTLAVVTYQHIVTAKRMNALSADATSSQATPNFQYKLLLATFVPLVFFYIPNMGVNHFAFFDMPSFSTACFPAWEAIIIIGVIRDYLQGLLGRLRKHKTGPATTTWKGVSTSVAPSTITPVC